MATSCSQSNRSQKFVHKSIEYQPEGSTGGKSGVEGPEPMDVKLAACKRNRVTEPFFLKNILLEKSGDTSDLTTLAISVHAVMLESGFLLLDPDSDRFSFSKELLSVSLRYTLPELITRNDTNTIESVTLKFQSLGYMVVVYGTQCGSRSRVHRVYLDKPKFLRVIDLVMDTLKFDKQGSSSFYREVFTFWRMVKDGLVIPLLTGLCDKAGLEPPRCLMLLPTELKLKILESLPGVSVAKMACVSTEMRYLASDNDFWKQKCLEESRKLVVTESGNVVNWKEKFAGFWRQNQNRRGFQEERRNFPIRSSVRYPQIILDHFTRFSGDRLHGSFGIHSGQQARRLDRRTWRHFWS